MSRLDSTINNEEQVEDIGEIYDDGISSVLLDLSVRPEKIVLWDADSMVHFILYSGKDEAGNRNPEYTEADLEMLYGKLDEFVLKTLNNIEKYFVIKALYIFVKGKGNFRKDLYEEYKANRPAKNPIINDLYAYLIEKYNCCPAHGAEAEDYVYTASKKINHEGIIVYVDHDLEELPGIFYNYKKNYWSIITEQQALYNKYQKLCICEAGDNVNLTPRIGINYYIKNFRMDMTIEEYEEALFKAYLKAWKGDEEVAREKMELARTLLSLKEIEEDYQIFSNGNVKAA